MGAWSLALWLLVPASRFVSVTVTPRVSLAPATVTITIHIPPDADNRRLSWTCDSGDGDALTSEESLDGADAAAQYVRPMRGLGVGRYRCEVRVFNAEDEPAIARTSFEVD